MSELLFNSNRRFQLWGYTVSHKMLLFWSPRSDVEAERVEVVFAGVEKMAITTIFDGLSIQKNDKNCVDGLTKYVLTDRHGHSSEVMARSMAFAAAQRAHFEPSEFDFMPCVASRSQS